jgi:ATP/maltotriose-dependent transcriptional regulator MalT
MPYAELVLPGRSRDGAGAAGGGRGLVSRPGLFDVLDREVAGRVTVVSAPPGSGKTVLLQSWLDQAGLAWRVAWVPVERGEDDAHRFWASVASALRVPGPSSFPDGTVVIEDLLSALAELDEQVVLVIDDLHELRSASAVAQLGLLLSRMPPALHAVLATRRDPQLGLGRLRLAGELTEIRAADLRFTVAEVDAGRSRFRYHQLFADLLRLELRRLDAGLAARLHRTAAQWHAGHGHFADAIKHAQAAGDMSQTARPGSPRRDESAPPPEALSRAELRVLRYLPSNLSGSEISSELFVSPNTVRTHVRHIYAKLGVHRRSEAVRRARQLGLLAPAAWTC